MRITDLHCDSVLTIDTKKTPVSKYNVSGKYPHTQFFAIFCDDLPLEKQSDAVVNYIEKFKKTFSGELILDHKTCEKALNSPLAGLISLEGTSFINSEKTLDKLYDLGVRSVIPAWNNKSRICATNVETGTNMDFGITEFGKIIISYAAKLGMILDVSHISDNGFYDLCELTDAPIIASHSNSREVCDHRRNLTDDMIKIIIERNGIIGLNIFPPFVSREYKYEDIFSHIDRILSLGGENAISFGFDIDGTDGAYFNEFSAFSSMHDFFIEEMKKHFSDEIIEKAAHKNADGFLLNFFCDK